MSYATSGWPISGSFGPSAGEPEHLRPAWQEAGLPISVQPIAPPSELDLGLARDAAYVRGILTGDIPNGFGNKLPEVARSLPFTTGATIATTRASLTVGRVCRVSARQ